MPSPLRVQFVMVGVALLGWASACGPSVQAVQAGTLRFEHCHRLDLSTETASAHRRACWQEWTSQYTYGQSSDRIDYARRRVRSLALGDPTPPQLNVDAPRRSERQFYLSVPAPTSAHASPPPIATRTVIESDTGPRPRSVNDECAVLCQSSLASCLTPCEVGDAGTAPEGTPKSPSAQSGGAGSTLKTAGDKVGADALACAACEPDYKSCMVRCYQ